MYGPVSIGNRTETAIVFGWLEPRTTKFCWKEIGKKKNDEIRKPLFSRNNFECIELDSYANQLINISVKRRNGTLSDTLFCSETVAVLKLQKIFFVYRIFQFHSSVRYVWRVVYTMHNNKQRLLYYHVTKVSCNFVCDVYIFHSQQSTLVRVHDIALSSTLWLR